MARFGLIQHVSFEGPGAIKGAAAAAGIDLELRRMWVGDPLPAPDEYDGLIVMGGPMGVSDVDAHPNLKQEMLLLEATVELGRPVLGVCLGAQLLARALGAEVRRGPVEEVGIGTVRLTDEGRADVVLGPSGPELPVLHWHQDTFDIPRGAECLASSDAYSNQAFRSGRSYALQFHVELDSSLTESLAPHLPDGVELDADRVAAVQASGTGVLERLLAEMAGPAE